MTPCSTTRTHTRRHKRIENTLERIFPGRDLRNSLPKKIKLNKAIKLGKGRGQVRVICNGHDIGLMKLTQKGNTTLVKILQFIRDDEQKEKWEAIQPHRFLENAYLMLPGSGEQQFRGYSIQNQPLVYISTGS